MPYSALAPIQAVLHPTKVLFVLPSLSRGGAEVQTVDLVNGVSPTQFEKSLVTFEKHLGQKERIDTGSVQFTHFPRRSKFDRSPAREIARLIDRRQIDVVHCSLQIAMLMGWFAIRYSIRKPKLIVALHTTLNRNAKNELFDRILYQWLMRGCDKVICVCHAQEKHWQRKFPFLVGKTQVIYNGIHIEQFDYDVSRQSGKALRQHLTISENAKVICHIAGFRPEKGHAILLNAFGMLAQHDPDAFLLFVGDGVLRPEIEGRVRKANLTSRVRFLGNMTDVRPALAASDCSVLASTAVETFSIAMLESMAMRVPMVATNIGGTAEAVLHGQTGLLVPANEPTAMADALFYILEHHEERQTMGDAGRNLVMRDFSAANMIRETERALTNVVEDL
jgi:glycosyltransferase involved in cell wall biosynthesis